MSFPSGFKKKVSPKIIGIDLGTTNSCVSVVENNVPVIIENEEGEKTTPSMVSFVNNEILIGNRAKNKLLTNPDKTIFASKRLIGRKFDEPELSTYLKNLPYKTTSHCNGDVWIKVDSKKYSPAQIGAYILSSLKSAAEKYLGNEVVKSVITVPAYFNDSQRQATKDAGKIAGLDVLRVINEPTAAALAYGLDKSANGIIAVYDLGGGTFDISILELDKGVFQVKATNGNTFLGGEDFDSAIVNYIVNDFKQKENIDLRNDVKALTRIKESAEKVKKELSVSNEAHIDLPYIYNDVSGPKHLTTSIDRIKLNEIVEKIIEKTIEPCKKAIKDANIEKKDIKHVILVGGMTRMPAVRNMVKKFFGLEPITSINPDEAVAKGAALQGGVLSGDVEDVLLLDVAPLSLGIELLGGVYNKIIKRNTTIPFKETQLFSTSEDNQTEVEIKVFQGERPMAADNKYLGEIRLTNITPAPRGVPQIEITFESDANGIYKVVAQDRITKMPQSIEIIPSSGLTNNEIDKMIKEAEVMKEADMIKKSMAELKLKVNRFVGSIDMDHISEKLSEEIKCLQKEMSDESAEISKLENMFVKIKNQIDEFV